MLEQILHLFRPDLYALTLASDPDNVLADETISTRLAEQGFSLIQEADPVRLHHRLTEIGGFSQKRPLIVITPLPLNTLPYELWQQGQHVSLALHTFFPNFSYPVIQALTPTQRRALSQQPAPSHLLGREESITAVLHILFDFTLSDLASPAAFVAWLNHYHASDLAPLPPLLAQFVQQQASKKPDIASWPLADLLADRHSFSHFITTEWETFVQGGKEKKLGETAVTYHLSFASNSQLQDTLPQLVRSGVLPPTPVTHTTHLPSWAHVAVVASPQQAVQKQVNTLLHQLAEKAVQLNNLHWSEWQTIATLWADLTRWRYQPDSPLDGKQQAQINDWQQRLDETFLTWLRHHYAPLSGSKLPVPSHVHHIPHFLAYQQRNQPHSRTALLVLDGMSLADWLIIRDAWTKRQTAWHIQERLLLAQIPTVTAVSRQALISGLRPADFAASLHHNNQERKQWTTFWQGEDLPTNTISYAHLRLGKHPLPSELDSPRIKALCLIHNGLDEMVHHASLGAADAQASLRLWLQEQSAQLESVITHLLTDNFTVYVTSDHGHVEAEGIGQLDEGVLVQTRSKRARLYDHAANVTAMQNQFSGLIHWQHDGLLPNGVEVLLAGSENGRRLAFAPVNTVAVTHGGLTLDECVVPFIEITQ